MRFMFCGPRVSQTNVSFTVKLLVDRCQDAGDGIICTSQQKTLV